ncbi:DciA family protein [Streptomyces sp. Edi2]|uniref:DciA family protein n=1 Tax=Streptomyces sp. Edi2 TaxID=3162528 RepID=UPI003305FA0A
MNSDEPSGVDLARNALIEARKAAAERGERGRAQRKPARRQSARRDGREPMRLGGAVENLVIERGWEEPVAGGTVIERWSAIVTPNIAKRLGAEAFHDDSRQLDLLPASRAWLVQGQLIAADLLRQVNEELGKGTVRKIHILSPDQRPRRRSEPPAEPLSPAAAPHEPLAAKPIPGEYRKARATLRQQPAREEEPAPARTREDACAGFHEALAGIRQHSSQAPQETPELVRADEDRHPGYRNARDSIRPADPRPSPAPAPARRAPHKQYLQILQQLHDSKVLSTPAS